MMVIEFYYSDEGGVISNGDDWLFILNNEVYEIVDAESGSTEWDDIVSRRQDIKWRVLGG